MRIDELSKEYKEQEKMIENRINELIKKMPTCSKSEQHKIKLKISLYQEMKNDCCAVSRYLQSYYKNSGISDAA